jgi:hypothetical protein
MRSSIGRSECQYHEYCHHQALYGPGYRAATQWRARSACTQDDPRPALRCIAHISLQRNEDQILDVFCSPKERSGHQRPFFHSGLPRWRQQLAATLERFRWSLSPEFLSVVASFARVSSGFHRHAICYVFCATMKTCFSGNWSYSK